MDLSASWKKRYKVWGSGFCEGRWQKFLDVRNFKDSEIGVGYWKMDPVRWIIPCAEGAIQCRAGIAKNTTFMRLCAETRSPHVIEEMRKLRPRVYRFEYDPERDVALFFFEACDYVPVFRLMHPVKDSNRNLDSNLYLPFNYFDPKKSMPNVGEDYAATLRRERAKRRGNS